MATSGLHERMQMLLGEMTYKSVADLTGTNQETVRRYMQGQTPSVEFLAALCRRLDLNAHWLLTGDGTMRVGDGRRTGSGETPGEMLLALTEMVERVVERVDRLERFVQEMEVRYVGGTIEEEGGRAGRVGGAVSERSRADAG